MNIRRIYPATDLIAEVQGDVMRIVQIWAEARARFGGAGDYLFGDWSAADMMFAPVVTRFITYSIPLPRFALPYCEAVIAHPHMQERSEEHTSELQSLMRISYAVFCLKKKKTHQYHAKYIRHTYRNKL